MHDFSRMGHCTEAGAESRRYRVELAEIVVNKLGIASHSIAEDLHLTLRSICSSRSSTTFLRQIQDEILARGLRIGGAIPDLQQITNCLVSQYFGVIVKDYLHCCAGDCDLN